jgi:hypothetical protein
VVQDEGGSGSAGGAGTRGRRTTKREAACSGSGGSECKKADESSKRQPGPKLSDGKEGWVVAVVVAAVSILVRACQAQPNQLPRHTFCRQGTATSITQPRQQNGQITAGLHPRRYREAGTAGRTTLPSFSAQFRESPSQRAGSVRAPRNEQTALAAGDRLQVHGGSKKLISIRRVHVMVVDVGRTTHVRHVSVGALPATAFAGGSNLALIPCPLLTNLFVLSFDFQRRWSRGLRRCSITSGAALRVGLSVISSRDFRQTHSINTFSQCCCCRGFFIALLVYVYVHD